MNTSTLPAARHGVSTCRWMLTAQRASILASPEECAPPGMYVAECVNVPTRPKRTRARCGSAMAYGRLAVPVLRVDKRAFASGLLSVARAGGVYLRSPARGPRRAGRPRGLAASARRRYSCRLPLDRDGAFCRGYLSFFQNAKQWSSLLTALGHSVSERHTHLHSRGENAFRARRMHTGHALRSLGDGRQDSASLVCRGVPLSTLRQSAS